VSDGYEYTDEQRDNVAEVIKSIMLKENIPYTNILRHCDITHAGSKHKILASNDDLVNQQKSRKRDP
jgi:N-acetyl-anhydromuramyl-L-alanine amidase AmpD